MLPRRGQAGEGELEIGLTTHSLEHSDVGVHTSMRAPNTNTVAVLTDLGGWGPG